MGTLKKDGTLVEEYKYDNIPYGTCTYQMNSLKGVIGRSMNYDEEDHLLSAGDADYQYNLDGFLSSKTIGYDVTKYNYSSSGFRVKYLILSFNQ